MRGSDEGGRSGTELRRLLPSRRLTAGGLIHGLAMVIVLTLLLGALEAWVAKLPPTEFGPAISDDGTGSLILDREPSYVP